VAVPSLDCVTVTGYLSHHLFLLIGTWQRADVCASLPVPGVATAQRSSNQQPCCTDIVQHAGEVAATVWQWCCRCALHVS